MKIYIDTNTFPASPAIYADAEKTKALPRILPAVELQRGGFEVAFLGANQPQDIATVSLAASIEGTQTQVVAEIGRESETEDAWQFDFALNSEALVAEIAKHGSARLRVGVIVEDDTERREWQLVAVVYPSASGEASVEQVESAKNFAERAEKAAKRAQEAQADVAGNAQLAESAKQTATQAANAAIGAADTAEQAKTDAESAKAAAKKAASDAQNALQGVYTKAETDSALATKADDADVVHLSGDEVITGVKLFAPGIHALPLGGKTAMGADAYGLSVSATGGLQLFGTHFLKGDLWTDDSIKMVKGNVSLYSTDEASIGFDYANRVIFRTMPNDGREAMFELQAWQWDDDSHTTKSASAGVKLLKPSQVNALEPTSVLNMAEGDARWAKSTELTDETERAKFEESKLDERVSVLEKKTQILGLGWFKPNDSAEADATVGRLDDKRRILIGLDKTGRVSQLTYGSYGADGLWHDNTGVYAGIYVKRYDHENQKWKTPVPAPHATGKTYTENTLDTMGIMPWAGFRDVLLENECNGEQCNSYAIKIPKFYIVKKYNVSIQFKGKDSADVGELKIILAEPPAESFSIGTGDNVVTIAPDDFKVHPGFIFPDGDGGTYEVDHVCTAKYFSHKNAAGALVSQPIAARPYSSDYKGFLSAAAKNDNESFGYKTVVCPASHMQMLIDLAEIEFATRDFQSVNTGATSQNSAYSLGYTHGWQWSSAENLDGFYRRGIEDIPVSGWVDYYGKNKTIYDKSQNQSASVSESNGTEYLTRFIYRGICADLCGTANCLISDLLPVGFKNGESVSTDFFAQELLEQYEDAGYIRGRISIMNNARFFVMKKCTEPFSCLADVSQTVDGRNFILTSGKFIPLNLVIPKSPDGQGSPVNYFDNENGIEIPSAVGSDGRVNNVDYVYSITSNATYNNGLVSQFTFGGSYFGAMNKYGLRCNFAYFNLDRISEDVCAKLCFFPKK